MSVPLHVREYVEAAKRARQRADSERNRQAKQILHEIERSYYRLVELEKWMVDQQQYNRPMTHFGLFNGRFATREDIVFTSADQDRRIRQEARRARPCEQEELSERSS
jgi:hypothetical protein